MSGEVPPKHLLLLFLLFLIPVAVRPAPSPPLPAPFCARSSCGNLTISYPFVLADTNPSPAANLTSFCGYSDLMLTCDQQNGIAVLPVGPAEKYAVTAIDYDASEISVTGYEAYLNHETCPRPQNLSLTSNSSLFLTPNDISLIFFLDCGVKQLPADAMIRCRFPGAGDDDGNRSYVFAAGMPANESWARECGSVVEAPVLRSPLIDGGDETAVAGNSSAALTEGFRLRWGLPSVSSESCKDCEKSSGRCGLNRTSNSSWVFTCFCGDVMTALECASTGNSGKMVRRIVIGVCAGIAGFLLACVLCFIWYKRNKKRLLQPPLKVAPSFDSRRRADLEFAAAGGGPGESTAGDYGTHLFSYAELLEATASFDSGNELGDGGFGTVYKGKLRDGRTVAVKRLHEHNFKRVEQFMNEVAILSRLRHQNLVTLYGCTSQHSRELLLVYEYVSNGTVADHLHGGGGRLAPLSWPARIAIAVETAGALAYLHAVEIIHRDVKSNNILLDDGLHVKVADFGLSRLVPPDATHVSTLPQGTPGYVDPEYHQYYQLTDKSDVYSFGVVLVELLSSMPAVDTGRGRSDVNLAAMAVDRIRRRQLSQLVDPGIGFESDAGVSAAASRVAELAFRCLQGQREMRPTMREVLDELTEIAEQGAAAATSTTTASSAPNEGEEDVLLAAVDSGGGRRGRRGSMSSSSSPWKEETRLPAANKPPPFSPESVMEPWESRYTTPNASS